MVLSTVWKDGMSFAATVGEHTVPMDAKRPIGRGSAMTPKELVVAGLCGCTAMDVAAYLRKVKAAPESLEVVADVTLSEGVTPAVFTEAALTFRVSGAVEAAALREAVRLSQTKYCGVSAMLSKAFPIRYRIELNGEQIGTGETAFP